MGRVARSWWFSAIIVAATSAFGLGLTAPSDARAAESNPCLAEREPNDSADQATALTDPFCLEGELPDGDGQDLWLWTIPDEAARRGWRFELAGVPGTITGAQVIRITSDPGVTPITFQGAVYQLNSAPDATGPLVATDVLLPAGRYVLALTRTARIEGSPPTSWAWRLAVEPTDLPPSGDVEPNDDLAHASPVAGAFEISGDLSGSIDLIAWTPGDPGASNSWTVTLRTPSGGGVSLRLSTEDGRTISLLATDPNGEVTIHDLRPAQDRLILEPNGPPMPWVLRATAESAGSADPEPNGLPDLAQRIAIGTVVRGRVADQGDLDLFRLTVDEATATSLLDLKLIARSGPDRELCLHPVSAAGDLPAPLRCSPTAQGAGRLSNLLLPAGDYLIDVHGTSAPDSYALRVDATSFAAPGFESEPNDTAASSDRFPAAIAMRGTLDQRDADLFRVRTDGTPQLWRLDASGTGLESLQLITADGTLLSNGDLVADGTAAVLTDLYWLPGDHLVRLSGVGTYEVRVTPLGPPVPGGELEPNDDLAHSELLPIGATRSGRLPLRGDRDLYRFSLAAEEHVRVSLHQPSDASVGWSLMRDNVPVASIPGVAPGATTSYDAVLPPGGYQLLLQAVAPTEQRYELGLEREDPFAVSDDREPNDSPGWAVPLPEGGIAAGDAVQANEQDWYLMPPLVDPGTLELRTAGSAFDVVLFDGASFLPLTPSADDPTQLMSGTLPAGVPLYVGLRSTGPYVISIGSPAPEPVKALPAALDAHLALDLAASEVTAWWAERQHVGGELTIVNIGASPLDLHIDARTSDLGWQVALASTTVEVAAGATTSVQLRVGVMPDAPEGDPVRVTLRASDAEGRATTVSAEVIPRNDAAPVEPTPGWTVPDALLGGLDVASLALGGVVIPSISADGEAFVHDGVTPTGAGLSIRIAQLPVTLTVDLAGEDPVPIAGTILNPLAGASTFGGIPREFRLLLSTDGLTFEPAIEGVLQPVPTEQSFVLSSSVDARFARLEIDSTWGGSVGELVLGEWKVVAAPGHQLESQPLNVGDPDRGGHVAWMVPSSGDSTFGAGLLSEDPLRQELSAAQGDRPTWVVGFQHDRAALLTRLEWVDPSGSDPATRLRSVAVDASLESPLGPWTGIGSWTLDRRPDGSVAPLEFEVPTWARFVRLTGSKVGEIGQVEFPGTLRLIEQDAGDHYRPAMGEWGAETQAGPLEWLEPPDLSPTGDDPDVADTPEVAESLEPSQNASGIVHAGADVDWYRLDVPEGRNSVTIELRGQPSVGARVALFDPQGRPVAMTATPGAGGIGYEASVTGGEAYDLLVEQPPFSVVMSFDTSGSLGPYLAFIQQALRAYASGVHAGQEWVQIQPFEEQPLLADWTDDPYLLESATAQYSPIANSSSMEAGVLDALSLLEGRDGARAVLLLTDAETTSYDRNPRMWQALTALRPRVFSVLVAGTGTPLADRRTMQDLAATSDGLYRYASSQRDLDQAFRRAAAWLRRPVGYLISWASSTREVPPPAPGTLEVRSPEDPSQQVAIGEDVGVEIILDTSGSMLRRSGGRRRIDIAKDVLRDLVEQRIPQGTPVAVRVLGGGHDRCGTELAVPLGPLDPTAVVNRIDSIIVRQATDTPLGQAIASVSSDLASSTGTRILLVITDSEEVWPHPDLCRMDPARAIRGLGAQGIDARLNIVGFRVTDRRARTQLRRWARLGNGSFFAAGDADDLGRAIRQAVSAPFVVYDQGGNEVSRGTVDGSPIVVPPGSYRVVVESNPPRTYDGVVVEEGQSRLLTVTAPGPDT